MGMIHRLTVHSNFHCQRMADGSVAAACAVALTSDSAELPFPRQSGVDAAPRKTYQASPLGRVGGVVTQRIANPCTPVRFRYSPPPSFPGHSGLQRPIIGALKWPVYRQFTPRFTGANLHLKSTRSRRKARCSAPGPRRTDWLGWLSRSCRRRRRRWPRPSRVRVSRESRRSLRV